MPLRLAEPESVAAMVASYCRLRAERPVTAAGAGVMVALAAMVVLVSRYLAASAPVMVSPVILTALATPAFLSAKAAVAALVSKVTSSLPWAPAKTAALAFTAAAVVLS